MEELIKTLVTNYPDLVPCHDDIQAAYEHLRDAFAKGNKLLLCGNGGSAADCEHIVGELMKGFMHSRPLADDVRSKMEGLYAERGTYLADQLQGALPAISLVSQSAISTAFVNDVQADLVFAQQVFGYGREGDVLLCLSTSGNSVNVVHAVLVAKVLGMKTIALTGQTGGELKQHCDVTIRVPKKSTPEVQERHLPIYHTLCQLLEQHFFKA